MRAPFLILPTVGSIRFFCCYSSGYRPLRAEFGEDATSASLVDVATLSSIPARGRCRPYGRTENQGGGEGGSPSPVLACCSRAVHSCESVLRWIAVRFFESRLCLPCKVGAAAGCAIGCRQPHHVSNGRPRVPLRAVPCLVYANDLPLACRRLALLCDRAVRLWSESAERRRGELSSKRGVRAGYFLLPSGAFRVGRMASRFVTSCNPCSRRL